MKQKHTGSGCEGVTTTNVITMWLEQTIRIYNVYITLTLMCFCS